MPELVRVGDDEDPGQHAVLNVKTDHIPPAVRMIGDEALEHAVLHVIEPPDHFVVAPPQHLGVARIRQQRADDAAGGRVMRAQQAEGVAMQGVRKRLRLVRLERRRLASLARRPLSTCIAANWADAWASAFW